MYKANIGYLLHPSIPTQSRTGYHNGFHLADVGAGTGSVDGLLSFHANYPKHSAHSRNFRIWLLDIFQSIPPSSHLSAFDISPVQFDLNRSLPPNITFTEHDLLKPFPGTHLKKYDVVHIRLMCLVLRKDEWAQAVKNLVTLLSKFSNRSDVDVEFG